MKTKINDNIVNSQPTNIYQTIKTILQTARDNAYKQVNFIMVEAYWNIGKQIVEEEQKGEDRAKYGSCLRKELSKLLIRVKDEKARAWYMEELHHEIEKDLLALEINKK